MEISPLALVLLVWWSFCFGMGLGVLHDVNRLIRVLCGIHSKKTRFRSLYARPLPIIHRPLYVKEQGKMRRGAGNVLMFFQDVLWFLVAAVGTVILHYEWNSGQFRLFALAATVIGFVLYYFTLGKLVMLASEGIVFVIKAVFLIAFYTFARPIRALVHLLAHFCKKTHSFLQKILAKKQKKMYNKIGKKELLAKASQGFLNKTREKRRKT